MAQEIFDKVNALIAEIKAAEPKTKEEVEQFRIKYLGSKNVIKPIFGEIKNIPNERKKEFGGNISFENIDQVKNVFTNQELHPGDLKNGISSFLTKFLDIEIIISGRSKSIKPLVNTAQEITVTKTGQPNQIL